jgi:hypothetical protein
MSSSTPDQRPSWRGDGKSRGPAKKSKWPRVAALGTLILAIAAGSAWIILSLQPKKTANYLAFATVAGGRPTVPADLNWLRNQLEWSSSGKAREVGDLEASAFASALAELKPDQPLILYISAPARVSDGRVDLLRGASDATVSLDALLAAVVACKSRGKLLVLDLYDPPREAASSALPAEDLARAVRDRLELSKDKALWVITATGPGQIPRESETLGRSVFADYLARGLGEDAGIADADKDSSVTVNELVAYIGPRVDDWSQVHFSTRQLPEFYRPPGATDLPLAKVAVVVNARKIADASKVAEAGKVANAAKIAAKAGDAEKAAPAAEAPSLAYPAELKRGWERRDRWRETRFFEIAPVPYHRLEVALRDAEKAWRLGVPSSEVSRQLEPALKLAETSEVDWMLTPPNQARTPQARSLAQAAILGNKTDPALDGAVAALARQISEKDPKDLAADWTKASAAFEGDDPAKAFALASAVVAVARSADPKLPALAVRLPRLNDWLTTRQPKPRFAEAFALRRLATVAQDWPESVIREAFEAACLGEQVDALPHAFARFTKLVQQAAADRHRAEVLLQSKGFFPEGDAETAAATARKEYASLRDRAVPLEDAQSAFAEATALLLEAAPYAERARGEDLEAWKAAADAVSGLWKKLVAGEIPTRDDVEPLNRTLLALKDRFATSRMDALVQQSRDTAKSNDRDYAALDALLASTAPNAADRAKLVVASRELAARLDERHRTHPFLEPAKAGADEKNDATLNRGEMARLLIILAGGEPPAGESGKATARAFRQAWEGLADSAAADERLARLAPAWLNAGKFAERDSSGWWLARRKESSDRYAWLADRDWFEGNDLDKPAFLRDSSIAFRDLAGGVPPSATLDIGGPKVLDLAQSQQAVGTLTVDPISERAARSAKLVRVIAPNDPRLKLTLKKPDGASASGDEGLADVALPAKLELAVDWSLEALAKGRRAPRVSGVLVQVDSGDRTYSLKIPVAGLPMGDEPEILLAAEGGAPDVPPASIRLRPLSKPQALPVFVRNPGESKRTVIVEVKTSGSTARSAPITLAPGETAPFKANAAPKLPPELPTLAGPIVVRVLDDKGVVELARKEFTVEILEPAEYIEVVAALAKYSPRSPTTPDRNRLQVQIRPRGLPPGGQPSTVTLNLSGAVNAGQKPKDQSGSAQVDPSRPEPVMLYAEGFVPLVAGASDAVFYLDVDNVPRALKFRVDLSVGGTERLARLDERPEILPLNVPRYVDAGDLKPFEFNARVDNGPSNGFIDVSLLDDGGKILDRHSFQPPRQRIVRSGLDPELGLVVDASVIDWPCKLSLSKQLGSRTLWVVLYEGGQTPRELARTSAKIFLDDDAPHEPQLRTIPPSPLPSGSPSLEVEAKASSLSEITSVAIYHDSKPLKEGEKPAGEPIRAVQEKSGGVWKASIPLRGDEKGTIYLTAQFTNGIKRDAYEKTSVTFLPPDGPGGPKGKAGRIVGKVFDGDRPQPQLVVSLRDAQGKEIDRKNTDDDGAFVFDKLLPGAYEVDAVKEFPRKKGKAPAVVSPEKTTTVKVEVAS